MTVRNANDFQTQDNKPTTKTFYAVIWEKAEHWTFDISIRAENEKQAIAQLLRDFPRKSYTIRSIR